MMNHDEFTFKSINNSINENNSDWTIISLKITKLTHIDLGCRYCLYRKILYLDNSNNTYQTGSLYAPLNRLFYIYFFINLILRRKTFGHYISLRYPNMYKFELIETDQIINQNNLLFNINSKIKVSKRFLIIPKKNLKFYVEEEKYLQ